MGSTMNESPDMTGHHPSSQSEVGAWLDQGRLKKLSEATGFRADLIAFLGGAIAALALPPVHALPVLLVVFPVLLSQVAVAARPIQAARRGWWFGFGYHSIGLYWITEAILFEAARFWWLVPLAVPAVAAVLALFVAAPVWVTWFARSTPGRVMTLAGGWVLGDLARQFVLTGFPWNPLGSVWALPGRLGDVMSQPASLVSVHGLTVATIILSGAPMLRRRGRAVCAIILTAWVGFGIVRVTAPSPADQNIRVALIQGNVPEGQKLDSAFRSTVFEKYLRLTTEAVQAAGPGPVVVVWPESASPYLLDANARTAIAAAARGATVLVGAVRFDEEDEPRNTLIPVLPDGTAGAAYDKWHLVPFGEFQPSWARVGIQLVPGDGFASGPGPETLHVPGVPPFGPLICYEAIFPGEMVNEADRPEWLVNVTNDAWFGTSAGPRQHLAAARMRAVEEGLPLMRAANTGVTAAFDSDGHEITRIAMEETGFRIVSLPGARPRTVFARFGLVLPGLLGLSLVGLGLRAFRTREYAG
jgi:apolipoprotein N-acyltransferase